jgi:type III secretory pathway component EscR
MTNRIALLLIIFLLICSGTIVSSENISKNIQIYTLKYVLETEAVKIDAAIPVIKGFKNKMAQESFNQKFRDDIINFTEDIKTQAEKFLKELNKEERPFFKYQVHIIFDVMNKEEILSLVLSYYQYTGGAHGLTEVVSYNLNPETGEGLSFSKFLLKVWMDMEQVKEYIITEINREPRNYFPDALDNIRNRNNFNYYLEGDFLIIYFQQYEIAPYAVGNPEFRIPLSD